MILHTYKSSILCGRSGAASRAERVLIPCYCAYRLVVDSPDMPEALPNSPIRSSS